MTSGIQPPDMLGIVLSFGGGHYTVATSHAAQHMALLFLTPSQVASGIVVGQKVRLTYQSSPSSGQWFATPLDT